jgi:hypothetical protein
LELKERGDDDANLECDAFEGRTKTMKDEKRKRKRMKKMKRNN